MALIDLNRDSSLLPGEMHDTWDPDEVEHWITVYEELLRTVPPLLAGDDGAGLPRAHVRRWQARLDFWQQRALQIVPAVGD